MMVQLNYKRLTCLPCADPGRAGGGDQTPVPPAAPITTLPLLGSAASSERRLRATNLATAAAWRALAPAAAAAAAAAGAGAGAGDGGGRGDTDAGAGAAGDLPGGTTAEFGAADKTWPAAGVSEAVGVLAAAAFPAAGGLGMVRRHLAALPVVGLAEPFAAEDLSPNACAAGVTAGALAASAFSAGALAADVFAADASAANAFAADACCTGTRFAGPDERLLPHPAPAAAAAGAAGESAAPSAASNRCDS